MAGTGYRYPKVCQITETDGVETLGEGYALGKGVKASITPKTAKKVQYADDGPAESVNMFTGGDGTIEVDDITLENLAKIAGAALGTGSGAALGEVTYTAEDTPPFFRYGHIGRRLKNNQVSYVVTVYSKVQFTIPPEELETQGEEIGLKSATVQLTLFRNLQGQWRWQKLFDQLPAAEQYLNEKINIAAAP